MTKSYLEEFVERSPNNLRRLKQEQAISEVTGLIQEVMDEAGVGRSKLAELLGKSPGFVTQILEEGANKTIRTVADVFAVLGHQLHFRVTPIEIAAPATTRLRKVEVNGTNGRAKDRGNRGLKAKRKASQA